MTPARRTRAAAAPQPRSAGTGWCVGASTADGSTHRATVDVGEMMTCRCSSRRLRCLATRRIIAGQPGGAPVALKSVKKTPAKQPDQSEAKRQKIAEAAYYRAQQRGFEPGYEVEDWLAAEAE